MGGLSNERARALVDRGFVGYARGQIAEALAEWRRAAAMEPGGEAAALVEMILALYPQLAGGTPRAGGDELMGARTGWCLVGEPVVLPAPDDDSVPRSIQPDDALEVPQAGWARTPDGAPVEDGAPLRAMTLAIPARPDEGSGQIPRHVTLPSTIPALLAAGTSLHAPEQSLPPLPEDVTRPMDGDGRAAAGGSHTAPTRAQPRSAHLLDAVAHIQQAISSGAAGAAAELAEAVLAEAEQNPGSTPQDMLDAARPVCERAFMAYVGSLTGIPVLLVPKVLLATQKLTPLGRRLVYQVNGTAPLERILEMTGTNRYEGLRALASLLRAGIIRIG